MHVLTFVSQLRRLILSCALLLSAILILKPAQIHGQNQSSQERESTGSAESPKSANLLPQNLGKNWQAVTAERRLSSDQWRILPDADLYSEYGLQTLSNRVYDNGRTKATVEVFQMKYTSGAFGLLTYNRRSLSPNRLELFAGRNLISIAAEKDRSEIDLSLIESLKNNLTEDQGQFPFLPSHLPETNKIGSSEIYLLGNTALGRLRNFSDLKDKVDFSGGVEFVMADYRNGDGVMSLAIIEYQTPQSASDGFAKLSAYLNALGQDEKSKRIFKRTGNYLIEAVNVANPQEATLIINQIKYSPKVYWEGRKLSDIPLDFRPMDDVAEEEATRTAMILLRSFYWVGVMLLSAIVIGVFAGGSFFYYKRYRRRKLGIDDLFSDSGGTIRLNLDDYLLQPDKKPIQQIGSGKK